MEGLTRCVLIPACVLSLFCPALLFVLLLSNGVYMSLATNLLCSLESPAVLLLARVQIARSEEEAHVRLDLEKEAKRKQARKRKRTRRFAVREPPEQYLLHLCV